MNRQNILILILAILVFLSVPLQATEREYALKAGLVYNFARFSQGSWFNSESEPSYIICSHSQKFVDAASSVLEKKLIQNKPIKIKHVSAHELFTSHCHSIFFTNLEIFSKQYEKENHSGAMTIGESAGFIESGGHINFISVGGKIRFEINPQKLTSDGIKISSKVIRLGKIKKAAKS